MEIKAADVKKLREMTGAGMMDCKKALEECKKDFDLAVDFLRKKGLAKASKKSGRAAADGLVGIKTNGNSGVVVELNSETDFVAKNDKFRSLLKNIVDISEKHNDSVASLLSAKYSDANTVQDEITSTIAVIGENINLRRVKELSVTEGVVASYTHNAVEDNLGKIGVLVALESSASDKNALEKIAKNIAMHIAAMRPESLNVESLDSSKVEKEKEIFKEQALKSGKPENIVNMMVEGRVKKYYQEVVLLEQAFVMDNKQTITEMLKNESKNLGAEITLSAFERFELGEGVESNSTDFAQEVASMTK